jgi:hypothetical protein
VLAVQRRLRTLDPTHCTANLLQDFLMLVQIDYDVGILARRLLRAHPILKKPLDGLHLASASLNNIDEFHTFDGENLLPLSGVIKRADGGSLVICEPPESPEPELFTYAPEPSF